MLLSSYLFRIQKDERKEGGAGSEATSKGYIELLLFI